MITAAVPETNLEDLALRCLEEVRTVLGFELDFTVETLPALDHYCRSIRTTPRWADRAEEISCVTGAYFGEVLRRRYPCRWCSNPNGRHAFRLEFEQYFLCFNPIGVALEMLLEGDALGWNARFVTWPEAEEALEERLRAMPAVRADDFYSFSVRSEVLETVMDFLAGWTAKDPPRIYDSAFYREQIAARGESEIVLTLG